MSVQRYTMTALLVGIAFASSMNCFAQQLPLDNPLYIPTNDCERCHSKPYERDIRDRTTDRVRLLEWAIWKDKDKHSRAYQVLLEENGRAQRMGSLMGKNVLEPSTGCIQCHTSNFKPEIWSSACMQDGLNTCVPEGVSCQTCHGPAEHWENLHNEQTWQSMSDKAKAELGFNIMENPVQRAEMCLSCHQGNDVLDRVITHEMYAAGHPPLSGFEMEGFADKMPRHWRFAHEKPNGGSPQFDRTRSVLLGSVIALRMAVIQAAGERDRWPELARLECYSCHHELRTPTWRQEPGHTETPGRPRLHLGCLPILRAAAVLANGRSGADQFQNLVRRTQQPFEQSVFGDSAQLIESKRYVSAWCAALEQKLLNCELGPKQALAILTDLITIGTEESYDFDTSRQLSGAMAVICEELDQAQANIPILTDLRRQLNKVRYNSFELSPQEEKRVELRYPVILGRRASYKPEAFTKLMIRFQQELSP